MSSSTPYCNTCQRSPPEVILLPCNNCSQTTYCSRLCEDADLATHQPTCDQTPSPLSPPYHHQDLFPIPEEPPDICPPLPLPLRIRNPHTRLLTNKYLHNLPQQDVFTILIDTHRLHLHEQTKYGPENHHHQQPTPSPQEEEQEENNNNNTTTLTHFIHLATHLTKPNPLLPPWWSPTSLTTLLDLASGDFTPRNNNNNNNNNNNTFLSSLSPETKEWLNLTKRPTISKHDIQAHYHSDSYRQHKSKQGNNTNQSPKRTRQTTPQGSNFVLQLRYLAQVIHGCPTTGGISFRPTVALLAEIEKTTGRVEDRRFWEYLRS
ncbi:hypothetical protein QBC41DRAFT_297984 [Cercophora samala]|uniref:MYND-type domain-containing protein n=1 Tax=Cercophora samala TaxID=330535 RepID=A0AA39ZN83_9PEZI|nr:hypothetical protein QBC41DRAFT_297984 [Cercophora samala]